MVQQDILREKDLIYLTSVTAHASLHAKSLQSCLTLSDPMDCKGPGSSVHGILQARTLGWVAMPSSGDLPDLGIERLSPVLQADSLQLSHWGSQVLCYQV